MTTIFSVAYSGLDHGEEFSGRTFSFTESCPDASTEMFEDEFKFCLNAKKLIERTFNNVSVRQVQPAHCIQ